MNGDSENAAEATVKGIEDILFQTFFVASQSKATSSVWAMVNSIYLALQSAMAIMPEGHDSERNRIHQLCIEAILTEVAVAERDVETALVSTLYYELCKRGFSSQTSAVSMTGIYCRWLKSRGQLAKVNDAISRVSSHIVDRKFTESLKSVVEKSLHADDPLGTNEDG